MTRALTPRTAAPAGACCSHGPGHPPPCQGICILLELGGVRFPN
jgi:hypothetical protein